MAAASSRRTSGSVVRSLSPAGRFYNSSHRTSSYHSSSSAFASSTSSSFGSRASPFLTRSASPTRVNLCASSSTIRFSLDRPTSPNRSISVLNRNHPVRKQTSGVKKVCTCSPTTHPGSFRCSLHKSSSYSNSRSQTTSSYGSHRLYARRSAMTNSLVRIGTVEGDLVKRALAALIRPSSHQQRRRADFQPRPSRLSIMS